MIAVYYLLGLFLYLFGILEIYLTKSADRKILYLIALLVFIGFVGLKIKGGTDFESYESMTKEELIQALIQARITEARLKKGYEVKGDGSVIHYSSKNIK